MKLRDWLHREGIKDGDFADRIGIARSTMSRYLSGQRVPNTKIVRRVREETNGEVQEPDWTFPEYVESREVIAA